MTEPDKYILIPPGGPSGPFWGIMKQSGIVIATQIQERHHAEMLITILSLIDGDFETVRLIGEQFSKIWAHGPDPGAEDYIVRTVAEAISNYVKASK